MIDHIGSLVDLSADFNSLAIHSALELVNDELKPMEGGGRYRVPIYDQHHDFLYWQEAVCHSGISPQVVWKHSPWSGQM
jgi:hypothetical protein